MREVTSVGAENLIHGLDAYQWKALAKKLREENQQLRITKAFNEHEIQKQTKKR